MEVETTLLVALKIKSIIFIGLALLCVVGMLLDSGRYVIYYTAIIGMTSILQAAIAIHYLKIKKHRYFMMFLLVSLCFFILVIFNILIFFNR